MHAPVLGCCCRCLPPRSGSHEGVCPGSYDLVCPITALLKPALTQPCPTADMGVQPLYNGRGSQKKPVRVFSREMQGLSRLQHRSDRSVVSAQPIHLVDRPCPTHLLGLPGPPPLQSGSSSSPTIQTPHTIEPTPLPLRRRFSRISDPDPRRKLCQLICRELHRWLHAIARRSGRCCPAT